jgi:hypothetical protein
MVGSGVQSLGTGMLIFHVDLSPHVAADLLLQALNNLAVFVDAAIRLLV